MKRIIEKDETNREVIKIHCEECCCDFETNEYFFLGEDEYKKLISENEEYISIANELAVDIKNYENQYNFFKEKNNSLYKNHAQRIDDCKEEYRKNIL